MAATEMSGIAGNNLDLKDTTFPSKQEERGSIRYQSSYSSTEFENVTERAATTDLLIVGGRELPRYSRP